VTFLKEFITAGFRKSRIVRTFENARTEKSKKVSAVEVIAAR
jgi:hypothetical protein